MAISVNCDITKINNEKQYNIKLLDEKNKVLYQITTMMNSDRLRMLRGQNIIPFDTCVICKLTDTHKYDLKNPMQSHYKIYSFVDIKTLSIIIDQECVDSIFRILEKALIVELV